MSEIKGTGSVVADVLIDLLNQGKGVYSDKEVEEAIKKAENNYKEKN